jgi:hypothetical protein
VRASRKHNDAVGRSGGERRCELRQPHHETRALAQATTGDDDRAAVQFDQTPDQRQTNAQAALAELQGDIDAINAAASGYQPIDSDLTTIGGLAKTKGNIIVGNGSAWDAQSVGTDGYALVAKSGATNGVQWSALLPAGTVIIFYQAAAPTGWTISMATGDKALRFVPGGGLGGTDGGSSPFSTTFAARTITEAMLPSHSHASGTLSAVAGGNHGHPTWTSSGGNDFINGTGGIALSTDNDSAYPAFTGTPGTTTGEQIGPSGTHTHTMTGSTATTGSGSTIDFAVQYCNVIRATKDAY